MSAASFVPLPFHAGITGAVQPPAQWAEWRAASTWTIVIEGGLAAAYPVISPDWEELEQRSWANSFAQRLRNDESVSEIWVSRTSPNLAVTVVTIDDSLEHELRIRGEFVALLRSPNERPLPELWVYGVNDPIPLEARMGERL